MADFSLAALDHAPPVTLRPSVWTDNLAALRRTQPAIAGALAAFSFPDAYRAAQALDGFVAFRDASAASPRWVGGSALPLKRAEPYVAEFAAGESNAALPCIAAGAELSLLLRKLPAHRAVFVFVEGWLEAAAALRAVDFARDIDGFRCILVPPEGELDALRGLLDEHPGLLPPGSVLRLPQIAAPRLDQVVQTCQRLSRDVADARAARLAALTAQVSAGVSRNADAAAPAAAPQRWCIAAFAVDARSVALADQLAAAAGQSGLHAQSLTVRGPRDVHLLAHAEQIARFAPAATLCVNHAHDRLPLPARGPVLEWWTAAADAPQSPPPVGVWRLAASPTVLGVLNRGHADTARVLPFFWAADADTPPAEADSDEIAIVADLPDASARACGIDLPTHKLLWPQLAAAARRLIGAGNANPEAILTNAERAAGLRISEPELRARFAELIRIAVAPAAALELLVEGLRKLGRTLTAVGTGWGRMESSGVRVAGERFGALPDDARRRAPLAAVFFSPADPLHPDLPAAAAHGWPSIILAATGHSPAALGGVLVPGQHVELAAVPGDVPRVVAALAEQPDRRRRLRDRARAYCLEHHCYEHRFAALLRALDKGTSPP